MAAALLGADRGRGAAVGVGRLGSLVRHCCRRWSASAARPPSARSSRRRCSSRWSTPTSPTARSPSSTGGSTAGPRRSTPDVADRSSAYARSGCLVSVGLPDVRGGGTCVGRCADVRRWSPGQPHRRTSRRTSDARVAGSSDASPRLSTDCPEGLVRRGAALQARGMDSQHRRAGEGTAKSCRPPPTPDREGRSPGQRPGRRDQPTATAWPPRVEGPDPRQHRRRDGRRWRSQCIAITPAS